MKTSNLMASALFFALAGAVAVGCSSSDSGGAAGSGGSAATGGTGGAAGSATGGSAGSATGGSGGTAGSGTGGTAGSGTGGTAGSGTGGSAGALTCATTTEITLTNTAVLTADGTITILGSVPNPSLGDASLEDQIQLQFYADDTGTIDLAVAPNDNFSTCMQCVLGQEDIDPTAGTAAREYFQTGGSVEIDSSTPPLTSSSYKIALTDVTLMEATIDWANQTYVSTFVDGGKCLHIASATVDVGCGNGKIDGNEQCDGTELGGSTCQSIGFTGGDISCNSSCTLNTSACTGWTCQATDLGAFAGTEITKSADTCTGTSVYNAAAHGTSCTGGDTLGKELVYTLQVPANTSVEAVVAPSYNTALWVTSSCDDLTGASCIVGNDSANGSDRVTIQNNTAAAVTYYVVVDGAGAGSCGQFDLHVRTPVTLPSTWDTTNTACNAAYYAAYDGCDCGCGAWDPDCDIAGASVYGCPNDGKTYTCQKPDGTCVAQ